MIGGIKLKELSKPKMIKNVKVKKVISKTRKLVKVSTITILSIVLILGIIKFAYRQTYSVSLNGQVIGYTNNKFALQKRINDYISGKNEDAEFVKINELPTYELCLLKKNIQTNDDEIFSKVTEGSTKYYKYYAIADSGEEKVYIDTFDNAQNVVNQLKEKDSANKDKLTIVEKYATAMATISSVNDSINTLYQKKYTPVATRTASSVYQNIGTKVESGTQYTTNLGVTLIEPVSGTISSRYGWRSRDNHPGLDIAAPKGTAIKAAAGGTVVFAGRNSTYGGYGNIVVIQSTSSVVIRYGHCSKLYVKTGEQVVQGQVIAAVGSTGLSTGNHLHFEIRYNGKTVNPQNYVYKGR